MIHGPDQADWITDSGQNAIVRVGWPDPRESANIRQILGRPGEAWLPESGTEHISVIRT